MKVNSFKTSESNFWEFNPSFQYLSSFSSIRKEDNSSMKKQSSYYMWFAYFMFDPESPYGYYPEKERIMEIAKSPFFKKFEDGEDNIVTLDKLGWLDRIFVAYKDVTMSPAQRSLLLFDDSFKEREVYIKSLVYTNPKDAEVKDTMLINTKKLLDSRRELEKLANSEVAAVEINNSEASLGDRNVI